MDSELISHYFQNVVVKELMFLICAIIGDLPLSESIFSHDSQLPFPGIFEFKIKQCSNDYINIKFEF